MVAEREEAILESWKEISGYLKRSIRTCRRWEAELGLPVHRLDGTPRARVFAYPAELDRWIKEKLHHLEAEEQAALLPAGLLRNKKKLAWAAGGLAAVLALGAGAGFIPPLLKLASVPVPDKIPALTILPFETPSGDKALEDWRIALPGLLITDLRQSRYLDVVPLRNLYARLMDMKRADAPRLTDDDLAALAKRYDPDFFVTGKIERAGKDLAVEIALRPAQLGSAPPVIVRAVAADEKGLIGEADYLSREIKKAVGLARREIAADIDVPLRRIATPDPEAVKLYARAAWPKEWGAYPDMVPALEKALAIDPEFGQASLLMYQAYGADRVEELVRCYEKALSHPDRLSEREALLLQVEFHWYCSRQNGLAKLTEAGIPEATLARLRPKTRREALPVLERLSTLYPGFFGSSIALTDLVELYMDAEDWDKAIAVLETVAPLNMKRRPMDSQTLLRCYLARGWIDKAEALIAKGEKVLPPGAVAGMRKSVALKKNQFDEVLRSIEEFYKERGSGPYPYAYHSERGYIYWLADDLAAAEKEHRAAVPAAGPDVEAQRSVDLAALSLSQGKIGQAIAQATRGLEIAGKTSDPFLRRGARTLQDFRAYLYRLAGRLPEALKDAEEACRGYQDADVKPGLAVALLHLRALIALDLGQTDDFERQIEEIRDYCDTQGTPKFLRAVHHLRGLQELKRGRGQRAIQEFERAFDLSLPETSDSDQASILFGLAEAYESIGNGWTAIANYDEIGKPGERESLSGDVYALSFYRKAKIYEGLSASRTMYRQGAETNKQAIEAYRKFLSLWGDADPLFATQVNDARQRLAALEAR
jgi:tetratricopeptide (TPR) repeat protein